MTTTFQPVFRDFSEIGLEPEQIKSCLTALQHNDGDKGNDGVILVTGPTGSGKSNTVEAMIRNFEAQQRYGSRVMQIGRPIEFLNQDRTQYQHHSNWNEALWSLRPAWDRVRLFNPAECRTSAEAAFAFEAAYGGHLVITTLHTASVAGTIDRLDHLGVPRTHQAKMLKLIVSQELVSVLCPNCKVPDPRGPELSAQLVNHIFHDRKPTLPRRERRAPFFMPRGCAACNYQGTKERTCITEVLSITHEVGRWLLEQLDGERITHDAVSNSLMTTLAEAAYKKLCRGIIAYDHVTHLLFSLENQMPAGVTL
jgi:type IV pilus assembly protein PilB